MRVRPWAISLFESVVLSSHCPATYRLRHSVALVLTVTLLVGCHHWVPIRVEALAQESVPTVRLTLWDESNFTVEQPTLVGDSIYGAYPGGDGAVEGAVALKNVRTVEVWELDKMKTAQWVVAGLLWGLMPLIN